MASMSKYDWCAASPRLRSWLAGQPRIQDQHHQCHTLFAKEATLNPTVQMAHIKGLEKSMVKNPMRSVDCKVYSIPAGARSPTHENLFLVTLPKCLVLCCIDNDAESPFPAKNNVINFLAVYVRQIPSKPFQPNFDDNLFVMSYMNLFTSTGKVWQEEGNGLLAATSATPRLHLIYLDMSKAFDTLEFYGVKGVALDLFKNY